MDQGRVVSIVGKVGNSNGQVAEIFAKDGSVKVVLQPGSEFASSFVEVVGKVNDDCTVQELTHTDFGDNFDMDNYNKLVELSNGKYSELFM